MLVRVVSSPFFGLSIIVVSAVYAAFAKDSAKKKNIPRWITITGWVCVSICAVLVVSVLLFDTFLDQSHVANVISELTSERHLSGVQKEKLKDAVEPLSLNYFRAITVAATDSPEANSYAIEIMSALVQDGLKIETMDSSMIIPFPMRALNTNVKGVFFQVLDPQNPPREAKDLLDAFVKAGITIAPQWYRNAKLWKDDYILTVGLK